MRADLFDSANRRPPEVSQPSQPDMTGAIPGRPLPRNPDRPGHREPKAHPAAQPFRYPPERDFVEPDWTRLPGYRDVTVDQWESAQWQRAHSVKNLKELNEALGPHLTDELAQDI